MLLDASLNLGSVGPSLPRFRGGVASALALVAGIRGIRGIGAGLKVRYPFG